MTVTRLTGKFLVVGLELLKKMIRNNGNFYKIYFTCLINNVKKFKLKQRKNKKKKFERIIRN